MNGWKFLKTPKKSLQDLKHQIDSTDKEINRLVYQLYGLTDEEIAVVEENVEREEKCVYISKIIQN